MFASERHTSIHLDDRGDLHNLSGPALTYSDDWELWALHGAVVRKEFVQNLGGLTPDAIANEKNVELRRALIEIFGLARFLRASGAKKVHDDKWGTLWRMDIPGEEPMVMVELQNSTPEPDGQFKTYFLRVPPDMQTPHEALAWSFNKSPSEYDPPAADVTRAVSKFASNTRDIA